MPWVVRPVFVGWITFVKQLPVQLFMTVWIAVFFGVMSRFAGLPAWSGPWLFGGLAFVAIPLVVYVGRKLTYAHTVYAFHDDRVEFETGFFSISRKVVDFRDVKEVTLRKGVLQRLYGLGTIYLATLATGRGSSEPNLFSSWGFGDVSASGVTVRDIANPDAAFERIRRLVDANRSGR